MIACMDQKKRKPGRKRKPAGEKSIFLGVTLEPAVYARLIAFVERYKAVSGLKVSTSSHVEKAILSYLEKEEPQLDAWNRP